MKKIIYPQLLTAFFCIALTSTFAHGINNELIIVDPTSFVSKPGNNTVNNNAVSLKVTANTVAGAKRFTIEISTSSSFSDSTTMIRTSTVDNQRTLTFSNLKYATKYYGRVKTDLSAAYGKTTSFTTRAEEFSYVTEPGDGSSNIDFPVLKILVAPVYQAKRYTVQLSTTPDFTGIVHIKTSVTDGQRAFVFQKLDQQTTYYTRVITNVSTRYGDVTSFATREELTKRRFWGITTSGGVANAGTVFSFSLDSLTFTKHHDNTSAEYLHGSLTQVPGGSFFGMGVQYSTGDGGEVFKISPEGNYSLIYSNGIHVGSLMLASDNNLYVVEDWVNLFRGSISRMTQEGERTFIFKFRGNFDGTNPIAAPIELDGYLYGMAPNMGLGKSGVIYRKKMDASTFQVLYNFNSASGGHPQGTLVEGPDGYLYGLTFSGGIGNGGTVFKIKPDGTNFTKLLDFIGTNGKYPFGDLVFDGEFFYGMTSEGGSSNSGVIFKINADGSIYNKLYDFNGINGAIPMGSLTVENEVLYGMTSLGGVNDLGVIFKINNNGSSYTKLFDFSDNIGNPDGSLLLVEDTFTPPTSTAARTLAENNSTNLENQNDSVAKVYPNPFNNKITVEAASHTSENFSVTMTDMSGRIVHHAKGYQILEFGNDLSEGMYIMKIASGNQVSTQRVIKR